MKRFSKLFLYAVFALVLTSTMAFAQSAETAVQQVAEQGILVSDIETAGADELPIVGAPVPWQIGFQDAASPNMRQINDFHNKVLIAMVAVVVLVMGLLGYVMLKFNRKANPVPSNVAHNTKLEVIWTVIPVLIVFVIAVMSYRLLHDTETVADAEMTIVATGYQWYWGYEYPDHDGINFLSYMIPDDEIKKGQRRLLETDNRLVLPVDTNIRIQVTAADVLHAFALPALGVKIDAIPGHTNETWTRIEKPGIYYGQCSEICGTGHGFMPITVEAVSKEEFEKWLVKAKEEFTDATPLMDVAPVQFAELGEQ